MPRIHVSLDKCVGCRICEMACSVQKTGEFGPGNAVIKTIRYGLPELTVVVVCQQCEQPECLESCPAGAIRKNASGVVEVDKQSCTGCGSCVDACSYHAIFLCGDIAQKCNLCEGSPECVTCCPAGALTLGDGPEQKDLSKQGAELIKKVFGEDHGLVPEQFFIK